MTTKNIAAADRESSRVAPSPESLTCCYMHESPFYLSAPLCRSLAAINATWVDLTNQRFKENFRLPRELAACTSLPAMLHAYSNYCQAAIQQYQSGLSEFQQIALQLMREVTVARLMPTKASAGIPEHSVHSSEPATDDALQ
jgi:Phasin protein